MSPNNQYTAFLGKKAPASLSDVFLKPSPPSVPDAQEEPLTAGPAPYSHTQLQVQVSQMELCALQRSSEPQLPCCIQILKVGRLTPQNSCAVYFPKWKENTNIKHFLSAMAQPWTDCTPLGILFFLFPLSTFPHLLLWNSDCNTYVNDFMKANLIDVCQVCTNPQTEKPFLKWCSWPVSFI